MPDDPSQALANYFMPCTVDKDQSLFKVLVSQGEKIRATTLLKGLQPLT